jgi:hypothetical protein
MKRQALYGDTIDEQVPLQLIRRRDSLSPIDFHRAEGSRESAQSTGDKLMDAIRYNPPQNPRAAHSRHVP